MFRRLAEFLGSSIGKKAAMSASGLLLFGFLVFHLAGNLTLYADPSGRVFDLYVEKLEGLGPLILVAEIGLALVFAAHVYFAFRVSMENREARPQGYGVRSSHGERTAASTSMLLTGILVLLYLVKHLTDFTWNEAFEQDPSGTVKRTLHEPLSALAYLVAMGALALHLSHAVQSACRTLGLSHPRLDPVLRRLGLALALILGLGFASFPVVYLLFWSQGAA